MANPQAEDGHIDIANEIAEALMKIELNGYQNRVLWAIFRKTYGWHKKGDWIANTQIAEMTGIAESHISRTIKSLIQRNIVTKNGKKLSFQKDYDKWKKLPELVSNEKLPNMVSKVTKYGKKKLPNMVDTKETKETITKEKCNIFKKAWKDFKDMRKKIRKPMTDRAEELLIKKLEDLSNNEEEQIAILNQSIMNSWLGVFPLKTNIKDDEFGYQKYKSKKITKAESEKYKDTARTGIKILTEGKEMIK